MLYSCSGAAKVARRVSDCETARRCGYERLPVTTAFPRGNFSYVVFRMPCLVRCRLRRTSIRPAL